jgi:hypothetical protein
MPDNKPLTEPSEFLRQYWSRFAQAAVWILSVVGVFLVRPPGLTLADDRNMIPFAGFLVAAILGLAAVPLHRWRRRIHAWRWWSAGVCFLILSVAGFFIYDYFIGHWTAPFQKHQIVTGTEWTPTGAKAREDYVSLTAMLEDFGGSAATLWDASGLEKRRRMLAVIYASCVAVSAFTIITIVQAVHCHAEK